MGLLIQIFRAGLKDCYGVFFAVVLFFSLKPGQILTWIGKILNPLFLILLSIFVIRALFSPAGNMSKIEASGAYVSGAFSTGLLEGYNTMDALAGLAFGIIVVNVIRSLDIKESGAVAKNTIKAGVFSSLLMALIYVLVAGSDYISADFCGGMFENSDRPCYKLWGDV